MLIPHTHTHTHSMAFYLEKVMDCTRSLLLAVSGWIPRHVIGAVLVSLPAVSVLSHLLSSVHLPPQVAFRLVPGGGVGGRGVLLIKAIANPSNNSTHDF